MATDYKEYDHIISKKTLRFFEWSLKKGLYSKRKVLISIDCVANTTSVARMWKFFYRIGVLSILNHNSLRKMCKFLFPEQVSVLCVLGTHG